MFPSEKIIRQLDLLALHPRAGGRAKAHQRWAERPMLFSVTGVSSLQKVLHPGPDIRSILHATCHQTGTRCEARSAKNGARKMGPKISSRLSDRCCDDFGHLCGAGVDAQIHLNLRAGQEPSKKLPKRSQEPPGTRALGARPRPYICNPRP